MSGVDLADVQGNVFRGYGKAFEYARHLALGVGDATSARAFIGSLVAGDGNANGLPQVTVADDWGDKPTTCLNVGLTFQGLQALGVAPQVLAAFPTAFQEGPAVRAREIDPDPNGVGLGDVGDSDPDHWVMGGTATPPVHIVLSLYAVGEPELDDASTRLRAAIAEHGLTEHSCHDAKALPDGRVHFGYRDGIAQPRIDGGPTPGKGDDDIPDMQPKVETGDFLLGRGYVNTYGGNYIGDVPETLAANATYGAFRIQRQDVTGFEDLLERSGKAAGMDPELVAAKLMGRWRNGMPLVLSPGTATPEPALHERAINEFDYAPGTDHPAFYDDADGLRCPVGAHIRRLNPRGSRVMGKPHSRRIVRRSMPYGPEYVPGTPADGVERGLVGYFICGDLEMQWEFIQRVWVHEDIATSGIRGTREPVIATQPGTGGRFTIRTTDARDPIVLSGLPTLVHTRGSAYCLLPGIGGLRHIASDPQAVTA
jgi:deferrochelatase/peroxidase EfeB